jgi:rhodanese-related sulfurtransferase
MLQFTAALLLAGTAANAAAVETPGTLAGVTVISAEQVRDMMRSGVPVYDVRVAAEYAESHVKGAKSLTYREKSAKEPGFDKSQDVFELDRLPSDKSAAVIFYCNAGDCWRSYKAAKVAADAGFKRVFWFRGGMPEWRAKGLPTD